jgi:hypothetical protein
MLLGPGCPVRCTDDLFGELTDVVIDPTRRRVTRTRAASTGASGVGTPVPALSASNGGMAADAAQ